MLVTIVAVPNADNTGIDPDRVEKVEDLPDEVAVRMLQMGTAREPSDAELDAYEQARPADNRDTADADDLKPVPAKPRRRPAKQQPEPEPLPENPAALATTDDTAPAPADTGTADDQASTDTAT